MNDILRPIDHEGEIGFDQFNQLIIKTTDSKNRTVTRVTHDLRDKRCSICGKPWFLTSGCWDDHWYWRDYEEHTHETCFVRYVALRDRDHFLQCALGAIRFKAETLIAVPNRYTPKGRWAERFWYQVDSSDGPVRFTLGHRKRVVHIEVTPTDPDGNLDWWAEAEKRFAGEDVTKFFGSGKVYVHSWSPENDKRYMRILAECAGVARRIRR